MARKPQAGDWVRCKCCDPNARCGIEGVVVTLGAGVRIHTFVDDRWGDTTLSLSSIAAARWPRGYKLAYMKWLTAGGPK